MTYYINKLNQKIAYKHIKGKKLGIIFVHGLNSEMNGIKALVIEKYAKKNKLSFLKFDCRGHGKSFGNFEDFTISDWKRDLIDVIDNLTTGPQIIIGSSMGGWLMMLAAKARPKRIFGLIGLATAIDFGKDLYNGLTKKNKRELVKNNYTKYSSYGFSYFLKKKFFLDAKKNNLLNKKFKFNCPFILIHGLKDTVVSMEIPKKIMGITTSKKIQIVYMKSSDHRLSTPNDLLIIINSIEVIRSQIKLS
jgi:pimeloyl-ACP methyl ester carboxylesterase